MKTRTGILVKIYPDMKKKLQPGNTCCLVILFLFFSINFFGQETNSRASGRVFSDSNEIAPGVTVSIIHEPTQNRYADITGNDGYFHFFNLKPGGPYSITFSSAGYEILKRTNLFIHLSGEHFFLGNSEIADFFIQKKIVMLDEVVIKTSNKTKTGLETNITSSALRTMPTINRNFQDFVRLVPQAKVTGDGVMSLAGQNNRFNALFIDGANNNDIQGTSVSGVNGGQTGSPPISMEAIEELSVSLAPYDVQFGNFTGGSINAITRSGSNESKSSAWYFFRNESMAGKYPQRLSDFFNQVFGLWNSGALVKNKLFYFALLEKQLETRPQPFNMDVYLGNSKEQDLFALSAFLKDTYQYDPGSFLETKDVLDAIRMMIKLDWNPSLKDKFTLVYRYNNAERTFLPSSSSNNTIVFENSGLHLPATTHSASFEWKHFIKSNMNNRMLLTFTNQVSNREWIKQPFPFGQIRDGNGTIFFGSEPNSGINRLNANDLTLFNVFRYVEKKHEFTLGTDVNYTKLDNIVMPGYFGSYSFVSLNSFISGIPPTRLTRTYFLSEEHDHPARFHMLRSSFFINDEMRFNPDLKFNYGLRLDINSVLSAPKEDEFFNNSVIYEISKYYDLDGATSGKSMKPDWAFSPRISVDYKLRRYDINFKGGAGIFVGHVINIWHFDVFNSNIGSIDNRGPQQFIPDPYNQPDSNLRDLNLIARNFKYPAVFRSSLVASKKLWKNWIFSIEGIFTKNIQDVAFRNVNILPPSRRSELPDSRNIYSTNSAPSPVVNSYGTVYLLTNNHDKKGHSYSISFIIQRQANNFSFNGSYTYGRSSILFELTGTQTPIRSQWRNMETVNGRNYTGLSTSDNDLQHRITTWVSKKFNYAKNKVATTISLFYNGQSGIPYSYVYTNSMINDNGNGDTFDLIYIPTASDLTNMSFKPITGSVSYTPEQQKDALNAFIESDKYLREHRGEFAKRNGARLPFTHTVDLRLQQDFTIKIKGKSIGMALSYDVFNFLNMLNKNWGQIYFLQNYSYSLITFVGYAPATPVLVPQYQFKPFSSKPYSLQTSTIPGNSARWISQLGLKIDL